MSDKIEISIIMPTFNAERTLEKSLTSIVNQTLPRECIEILVIDGGSTDQTVKIAERFGAKILKNEKRLPVYDIETSNGMETDWNPTVTDSIDQ